MTAALTDIARAKVNLTLHVTGRRPDGYRLLDSLVVFPEIGDRLSVWEDHAVSLTVAGPFSDSLNCESDNLVLQAASSFAHNGGARILLEKRLPVAAGIGGGSADAAAALRLLSRLWRKEVAPGIAERLGADVPVCLASRTCRMRGIGEQLDPVAPLPPHWLVLVNRGQPVPTGSVFAAMDDDCNPPLPVVPEFGDASEMSAWLSDQRNDLQSAALTVEPGISIVLAALAAQKDCLLARMSGSGGTCFGLFADGGSAEAAAKKLVATEPNWWVKAAPVGLPSDSNHS